MRINGYPQEQKTWARVSGYVEQSDIHSPQVTLQLRPCWTRSRLPAAYNANVSSRVYISLCSQQTAKQVGGP